MVPDDYVRGGGGVIHFNYPALGFFNPRHSTRALSLHPAVEPNFTDTSSEILHLPMDGSA